MLDKLIKAFFPSVCPLCGRILSKGQKICKECVEEIVIIEEPKCIKCGKPLHSDEKLYCNDCNKKKHYFEKGVSVFEYSGAIRDSIHRFKYKNARENADYYGYVAGKLYRKIFKQWKIDVIIPVPMYNKKEGRRGYNQAEVFAREVSRYTGIRMKSRALIRTKNTVPQKELNDERRRENLFKAFAVNEEEIRKFRNVLLVDDIYTTGSTIDACAKLLLAAGVEKVYFLCISSGK